MGQVHATRSSRGGGNSQARTTGVRKHSVYLTGRPQPKERPRFNRATGRTYTPAKTEAAESRIAEQWTHSKGPLFPKDVQLKVWLHFSEDGVAVDVSPAETIGKITLRGDIDNYVKTVLDGLNGTAWEDDIQVVEVTAVKS